MNATACGALSVPDKLHGLVRVDDPPVRAPVGDVDDHVRRRDAHVVGHRLPGLGRAVLPTRRARALARGKRAVHGLGQVRHVVLRVLLARVVAADGEKG